MRHPMWSCAAAVLIASAFWTGPTAATHHSFAAQYDASQPITLNGYVTKVEWRNPHVYFFLDVEEDSGGIANWGFEMGAPVGLERLGWNRNSMRVGDIVQVEGSLARDGSKLVNANSVVLSTTGQRLFAGSSRGQEGGR